MIFSIQRDLWNLIRGLLIGIFFSILLVACGGGDNESQDDNSITKPPPLIEILQNPKSILFDTNNNRLLVTDTNNLFSVDLTNGTRRIIFTFASGASANEPQHVIALDSPNNRALLIDRLVGQDALLAIDLSNGGETVIANADIGAGAVFDAVEGIALDTTNNRVLIVDSVINFDAADEPALIAVDLSNGNRTIISNSSNGTGPDIGIPTGLTFDQSNDQVFITTTSKVIAINLATGDRRIVTDDSISSGVGTGPSYNRLEGLVLDKSNNRLLVTVQNFGSNTGLLAVDLATGNRSIISDSTIGSGQIFLDPIGITLDKDNDQVFITDPALDVVFAVNLTNGNRTVVSSGSAGTGPGFNLSRNFHQSIVIDDKNNRAFIADKALDTVFEINLNNGNRNIISSPSADSNQALDIEGGIALDNNNSRILVGGLRSIFAVDLNTGTRSIFSNEVVGVGPMFNTPAAIAVNGNSILFVSGDTLYAVNASNGNRSIFSTSVPGNNTAFVNPGDMVLDVDNNRVLVLEYFSNPTGIESVIDINLSSGERSAFLNPNVNSNITPSRRGIALDSTNNRLLITNIAADNVIEADLATGNISPLVDTSNSSIDFQAPFHIGVDNKNNRALVIDISLNAVIAIDLATGSRSIFSKL